LLIITTGVKANCLSKSKNVIWRKKINEKGRFRALILKIGFNQPTNFNQST